MILETSTQLSATYSPNGSWILNISNVFTQDDNQSLHINNVAISLTLQRSLRNIVTPMLCTLGCTGNIINLLVLSHIRFMKTSSARDNGSHLGLIMLAISELLFCISLFPRAFVPEHGSLFKEYNFKLLYQVYGTGIVTTFILISTWLTVIMAFLRYIGICHPFASRRLDGAFIPKILYFLVFIICTFINIPTFFHYRVMTLKIKGKTCYLLDIGFLDQSKPYGRAYVVSKALFGIFVPCMILVFCNCSLIMALKNSYRMRRQCHVQESAASITSNRLTLTLIIIVIAFIILVIPCEMMDFFSDFIRTDFRRTEIFLLIRSVTNVCQILNFSFNFILYCIINVHFRAVLFNIIRCRGILNKNAGRRNGQDFMRRNLSLRTSVTNLGHITEVNIQLQRLTPNIKISDPTANV